MKPCGSRIEEGWTTEYEAFILDLEVLVYKRLLPNQEDVLDTGISAYIGW